MTNPGEDQFPATYPQDKQRCTRQAPCKKAEGLIKQLPCYKKTESLICRKQSPCKKAGCLQCNKPENGTHHVRDLSQELGFTPKSKPSTKPTSPPDHNFHTLTERFQQAFLENEMEDIKQYTYTGQPAQISSNLTELNCSTS